LGGGRTSLCKIFSDWALAACGASNKVGSNNASQLGLPLTDFDQTSENFDDWAEARLVKTLGTRKQVVAPGEFFGVGGAQPIFQVNMSKLPQLSLSQMDMSYNRGVKAHKRATETAVVTGTKYTLKQLIHLLAFCGLSSREKDLLPQIWSHLQATKAWHDLSTEITKWFKQFELGGDIPVQFHEELVDDILKLMFSLGSAPLVDNSHRGMTPLVFVLLTVGEEK